MFFLLASFLSLLATQIFVYSTIIYTHSHNFPTWLAGGFYGLCFIPFFIFSVPIGKLADRVNKKRVLIAAHGGLIVLIGAAGFYGSRFEFSMTTVMFMGLVFGITFLFIPSFRYGLISDLFVQSKQANTLIFLNVISVSCVSSAPLVHALAVEKMGDVSPLFVSFVLIVLASLFYFLVGGVDHIFTQPKNESYYCSKPSYKASCYCVVGVFLLGPIQSILPRLIDESYPVTGTIRDVVMASIGAGMILSLPIIYLVKRLRRVDADNFLAIMLCLACGLIGLVNGLPWLVVFIIATTAFAGALVNRNQAIIQQATPKGSQGQVMAFLALINMGVPALTGFFSSVLANYSSTKVAFIWMPILLAIGYLFFMFIESRLETGQSKA